MSDKKLAVKPIPELTRSEEWEFWSRVDMLSIDGCWNWTATVEIRDGYAVFNMPGHRTYRANRVAVSIYAGSIPDDMEIDHKCTNRLCVNPTHLEPVTHSENMYRTRGVNCSLCGKVYDVRYANGRRACRSCKQERDRRNRA